MPNYFIFPIGDPSGDGHAYVAEYMVKSDASLKEVRETHFQHHWIGEICSEYQDNTLSIDFFEDIFANYQEVMNHLIHKHDLNNEEDEVTINHDAMIDIWILLLNHFNPKLNLEIVSPAMSKYYIKYKGYPFPKDDDINFSGYDKKGRHLKCPGYGVWNDYSHAEFYLDCN